ncbi:MAG: SoxR reducing system RseC family protein [Melioribacteraceae bacterium]|jgi:positive regulator of sigma E activity|nr:SoxR reducing system RseC family protein [Melioribacteraceae bacterium]
MQEILKEKGIVKSFNGNNIEIVINSSDDCEECTAKLFCNPSSDSRSILSVSSNDKFQIGDSVEIAIKGKSMFLFSFFLYGLPLIILITTLLIGLYTLGNTENKEFYSFLFSVILMVIYYLLFNRFIKHNTNFFNYPTIIKTDNSN